MKYQVLARKYRPKSFTSMMGQEHVLKALTNALDTGRLHHAYLFSGTRGVGKTTVARVLARALNCEQGITAAPCGKCSSCSEIDEGRFVDLIEVDAASRTKVEDTRELLENVQYAPTRGRFKIYLIDEVHMLSGHSFNALLKTLEEPPPHVKFLLATTDPQKLPVTILSRCLQFNLKRLTIQQIEQQLRQVLDAEQLNYDTAALKPLAVAADGSMRDALSLLDQSIAYTGGQLNLSDIEAMLGCVQKDRVFEILTALAHADGHSLIEQSRILTEQGIDVTTLLAEIITLLQRIALFQQVPDAIDDTLGDHDAVETIAQLMNPEDVQLYYQIALNGRKDLPYSPQPQGGFEMILLRMLAFRPANTFSLNDQEAITDNTAQRGKKVARRIKKKSPVILQAAQSCDQTTLTETELLKAEQQNNDEIYSQADNQTAKATAADKLQYQCHELPPLDAYSETLLPQADEAFIAYESQCSDTAPEDETKAQQPASLSEPVMQEKFAISEPLSDPVSTRTYNSAQLAAEWHELIASCKMTGLELQLARHCALKSRDDKNQHIVFNLLIESVHMHLLNDKMQQRMREHLQEQLGQPVKLKIGQCHEHNDELLTPQRRDKLEAEARQQEAVDAIYNDSRAALLIEAFDATIIEKSIKPL